MFETSLVTKGIIRYIFHYIQFMWRHIPLNFTPTISPWVLGCPGARRSPVPELRGVDGAVVEISLRSLALRPRRQGQRRGWKRGTNGLVDGTSEPETMIFHKFSMT